MPALLERASRMALDLLFPPQCAVCYKHGALLCWSCQAALPLAMDPRCRICWDDLGSIGTCRHCASAAPPFSRVRAPFTHAGGARTLVHALKYGGLTSLAESMAHLMLTVDVLSGIDCVVPVPLHPGRQRQRGYNQAAMLGHHMASPASLKIDGGAVRRVRPTKPLAESMNRDERREIVEGAFAANPDRIGGLRVLLVDDVVTTGATLAACSEALLQAGAASVRAVTFTRA